MEENTPCMRWAPGRTQSWRRPSDGGFDKTRYGVQPISEAWAEGYVLDRHYSGSYPNARLRYGLFDLAGLAPLLCGVAVLSVPVQEKVLTSSFPCLTPYYESLDLGRFVLDDEVPANGESWFLGEVFRLAAEQGIRGVTSDSDPMARADAAGQLVMPGHLGIIYQATNARYVGRTTARTLKLLPDGTVFSDKAAQKIRKQERGHEYAERQLLAWGARPMLAGQQPAVWLAEALADAQVRRLRHHGNHRYLFSLGNRAQRRAVTLGKPSLAYPKTLDLAA